MRSTEPATVSWPPWNNRSHDCPGSGKETFSEGTFWTGYGKQTFGRKMLEDLFWRPAHWEPIEGQMPFFVLF
jgi:hypothetical protein